ncbi:MAG: cytochrome c-type biogenesis protein CcmH [Gammaproteobacteria bacterium]|nr:cytochrome c-type biogenesis protein CcmH [Gammaproteobacteria bacterium]
MRSFFWVWCLMCLPVYAIAHASNTRVEMSMEQQQRYTELTQELRCLVCQNEALSDSQSVFAKKLRQQISDKIVAGESKQAIVGYLTSRYGDFILYKPPFQKNTYLLWSFPLLALFMGMIILSRFFGRRAS